MSIGRLLLVRERRVHAPGQAEARGHTLQQREQLLTLGGAQISADVWYFNRT